MQWWKPTKYVAVLSVLMVFTAACGDDAGEEADPAAEGDATDEVDPDEDAETEDGDDGEDSAAWAGELSDEELTLEFPSWQANEPGFEEAWAILIEEFESRHPNVEIDFYHVSNDEFQDRMVTRLSAGDPPDILPAGNHYLPFVATGQVEPLGDMLEEAGILANWNDFQEGRVVRGEQYGLATHALTRHLHVNMAYLNEVGIEEPPSTPDELREAAHALADADLGDVAPWGATTTSHANVYGESTAFVLGMGGDWVRDGEWYVTAPETVEALELYRELAQMAPPGQDGGGSRQLLADGQVAMAHDGNWVIALLDDLSPPEIREDIVAAVSPFEQKAASLGATLMIPSDSPDEHKAYAWEFIKLTAEPEFNSVFPEYTDAGPGHVDGLPDELVEERPELEVVADNMVGAVDLEPDSDNVRDNFGEVEARIIDALMRLQTSDDDINEVLEDLEQTLMDITEP